MLTITLDEINYLRKIGQDLEAGRNTSEWRTCVDLAVADINKFCDERELAILRSHEQAKCCGKVLR